MLCPARMYAVAVPGWDAIGQSGDLVELPQATDTSQIFVGNGRRGSLAVPGTQIPEFEELTMMIPFERKPWIFLVYSTLGLMPALALACEETPVDSPAASTSAEVVVPVVDSGVILATSPDQREGRGQRAKERLDRLFQRFDRDGDGKIALRDLPERLRERLAPADTNKDGQLTRDEITRAWQATAAEMKKKMDTNGDGVISDDERAKARAAFWDRRFAELDRNRDGFLTADEVPSRMWDHIKVADANGDSKITRAEIDAAIASGKLKPMHPGHRHDEGGSSPKS